jgi:predicted Rossmann fold nucleotide-binding protein DprA/Smf involved in DNA uptake
MISAAVTGSRELGPRTRAGVIAAFDTLLLPFARLGARWVLGGAAGIDTMVLDWLTGLDHPGSSLVVVPVTVADQPPEAQRAIRAARDRGGRIEVVELRHPAGVGPAAWTARNMFMVEQSQIVIGFPATDRPDQSGTWETLNYARRSQRALLTVPASWPAPGPDGPSAQL